MQDVMVRNIILVLLQHLKKTDFPAVKMNLGYDLTNLPPRTDGLLLGTRVVFFYLMGRKYETGTSTYRSRTSYM